MTCVAAVVVTFNRLNLLKICLESIKNQTFPVEKIYLVDNASTDGTEQWVKEFALVLFPNIQYIRTEKNLGGAGGFALGMRKAYDDGVDYMWLMDDDVAARPNCLKDLLNLCGNAGIIHPTRYEINGNIIRWHHYYDPFTTIKTRTNVEDNDEYLVATNVACFEGALIKRQVVELIGFPCEDYFIHNDDMIYGYLTSRKFPVLYTSKAKMDKLILLSKKIPPWKMYFVIRNEIISQFLILKTIKNNKYKFFSRFFLILNLTRIFFQFVRSFESAKKSFLGVIDAIAFCARWEPRSTPVFEENRIKTGSS